jgi:NAD+--asparagine ADP-ribosyltransferase
MKKTLLILSALFIAVSVSNAQSEKRAKIEFEKTTIDLGKFGQEEAVRHCQFIFKNTGDANLYIHQIIPTCSCTSNKYPTHAIAPGASDTIFVTYNGEGKSPRKFRSSITIHSNAVTEMTKIYIKGELLPAKVQETPIIEIEE